MSETNKTYRVRTNVGADSYVNVMLDQDYDAFDILSVSINSADIYKLHNANYGVVVGRVYANGGFGVPNAKLSIFIGVDSEEGEDVRNLYPYISTASKDNDGVRYNLLPDEQVSDCHQVVGTFPNKRYLLDNDVLLEVFDKYYKYTTRTNNAGDYIICGVPTGAHTLHMDLDLSDCGILSQRPRDFVYKGYTIEQFENPNQFKKGTEYSSLSQIFSQDQVVNVQPFWGNSSLGETIGITRADVSVAFKFEPTCVFMGSVASDNASQGISKKCIPTDHMGDMDELTTGEGTIEMIRKTFGGSVEEFQVKGTELINSDGIWCYQIPMNLDYMTTDEYGNMVPTDNPEKGIPTRTRVRFRISMQDMEENTDNFFRAKVLVPHNPQIKDGLDHEDYDYEFGTYTRDESFRDLFWNNVYSVKSYIPRFQKKKVQGWKESKFTGIKHCQDYGANNPIPYNNIRIQMPFMFKVMCILIKIFIKVTALINTMVSMLGNILSDVGNTYIGFHIWKWDVGFYPFKLLYEKANDLKMNVIDEGLCPDLENWYFAPMFIRNVWTGAKPPRGMKQYDLLKQTLNGITISDDPYSVDDQNQDTDDEAVCLTTNTDYLISCIEMNLASEYKVINFDFYNDWINGLIYFPRWMRFVRKKKRHGKVRLKVKACMDDRKVFSKTRKYTQLCSLGYYKNNENGATTYSTAKANLKNNLQITKSNNYHKKRGFSQVKIFGKNGGICHEKATFAGEYVYYMKPCEWQLGSSPANRKVNLFATDIILLGSLNDCDINGVPQAFKHLSSTSYIMPTNLALTNMETNGPLYAFEGHTICSKHNQTTNNASDKPISVSENGSLADELTFYSGASENYDTQYDKEELSDTIALTEAAGISWNWSGPGQGGQNKKIMYYPGGHFLGISCVNAQTNIKSCINLERICEVGTSMSQRKEDFRTYDEATNEIKYTYSVPTGLISGDDILDDDFRTMFATMNQNRLIATKINPETGYRVYDFTYIRPNNFNGEFKNYVKSNEYNKKLTKNDGVKDESDDLSIFGIANSVKRDDNDSDEIYFTQRRTIEALSVDYYMFRLGIPYSELASTNSLTHRRRFAMDKQGAMYLPQYENSYYFYFGMRNGATAIDEFNKQFFSQCQSRVLSTDEAHIELTTTEEFSPCKGTATYSMFIENMEPNYSYEIYNSDGDKVVSGSTEEGVVNDIKLEKDVYTIKVVDDDLVEATTTLNVGMDVLIGEIKAYDFNVSQSGDTRSSGNKDDKSIYTGGYVEAKNVLIKDANISSIKLVSYKDTTSLAVQKGDVTAESKTALTLSNGTYNGILYLESANTKYDIYIEYECAGSKNTVKMYALSCTVSNTNQLNLQMGDAYQLKYIDFEHPTSALTNINITNDWWTGTTFNNNTESSWMIRHCLFNENISGETLSSNNVSSVNGIKAVFGTPQYNNPNAETGKDFIISNNHIHSSEVNDGYEGTVDDDASYTYTYGVEYYSGVSQYYSMTYNGNMVCGDYAGKITTSTESNVKDIIFEKNGGRDKLPNGSAAIFKPLPEGDLIFGYINDSGQCVCLNESGTEADVEYTGIVYPTFKYPSINRPFTVDANFFRIMDKHLIANTNEDGTQTISAEPYISKEKVEAIICNGLTYGDNNNEHKFGKDSYMSLIESTESLIKCNEGDMNGISRTECKDREKYINYSTSATSDDHYYEIFEGYPEEKAEGFGNSRMNKVEGSMYDTIHFSMITNTSTIFTGEGNSDDDVIYYFAYGIKDLIEEKKNNYLSLKTDKKNVYIYAVYTSGATYDNEGATCLIHLRDEGSKTFAYIPFKDENGDIKTSKITVDSRFFNWLKNDITDDDVAKFMDEIFKDGNNIKGKIEAPKLRVIKDKFDTQSELSKRLVPNILPKEGSLTTTKYRIDMGKALGVNFYAYKGKDGNNNDIWDTIQLGDSKDNVSIDNENLVIVGAKRNGQGTSASITLNSIYLYPTKIKSPIDIESSISANTKEIAFSLNGGSNSVTVTISGGRTQQHTIVAKPSESWINVNRSKQTISPNQDAQTINFVFTVTESESERKGYVTIYDEAYGEFGGIIISVLQNTNGAAIGDYQYGLVSNNNDFEFELKAEVLTQDGLREDTDDKTFTYSLTNIKEDVTKLQLPKMVITTFQVQDQTDYKPDFTANIKVKNGDEVIYSSGTTSYEQMSTPMTLSFGNRPISFKKNDNITFNITVKCQASRTSNDDGDTGIIVKGKISNIGYDYNW